ncbi:MAG: hypothetical protein K9J13_02655 [Saprospiraceae bacterium]|nr:hypothetical protein [Saprospiraceae bacterium]
MKKRKIIFLAIFIISLFQFSCTKDKIDDVTNNLIGTMECKVDNVSWKAGAPIGTINNNKLIISGLEGKKNISLMFYGITVGDYTISVSQPGTIYIENTDSTSTSTYAAYEGLIKLTKIDSENKKATGSFYFTAINPTSGDTLSVTNGSFANVNYP